MTDHATRAWALHRATVRQSVANASPRRMIVHSIEPDGTLIVREVGTNIVHDEPYQAMASPTPYAVGDYVLVGEVLGRGEEESTGTRVVLGKAGIGVSTITDAASDSGTTTNASDTVFVTTLTLSLPLPAGSWVVVAKGDMLLSHNVNRANFRVEIDGNAPAAHTLSLVTADRVAATHSRTVTGNRTIPIRLQMKSFDAGTATARNPALFVTANRTG